MCAMRTGSCFILGLFLTACPFSARAASPALSPPTKFPVEDEKFAALAKELETRNLGFDQIFACLCRTALTNQQANPKINLADETRSIWGGLWLWQHRGGRPSFQAGGHDMLRATPNGRIDHGFRDLHELQQHYAQHFIAGGMFEAYFDWGREAGVAKERADTDRMDDYFDFNKVAVTTMGAQWVDMAVSGDAAHTKRWLELWASGQYTLSKSMPKLHWGSLPIGTLPTREQVDAVERDVAAALTFPKDDGPESTHNPARQSNQPR
jgi:hypothetical protein